MTTIRINKNELIEKTINNEINNISATGRRERWQVHVFHQSVAKIVLHQEGDYYPLEVGRSVDVFDLMAFFDWKGADMNDKDLFEISRAVEEARDEFAQIYNLDKSFDEGLSEKMKSKLQEMEEDYMKTTREFTWTTLSSNLKNKIDCIDAEGTVIQSYNIEWA